MKVPVLALALVSYSAPVANAQDTSHAPEPPFESYAFIQYAATAGPAPQNVLRLDNNGELVLAARGGITRERLEEKVPVTDSQIALLKSFRLLEEHDDTLTTAFPILDGAEAVRLREWTGRAAPGLAEELAPEVRRFVRQLREAGREANAYTMLFSYVLDGLVWEEFERDSLVPVREITAENPLWAGEVWALYPPRPIISGTNSIAEGGIALKVGWTEAAIPRMAPFVADFPTLIQMLHDYIESGKVEDARVREVFGPFDLFDESGRFTIPVLVEEASNPLYRSAMSIARRTAARAPALLDVENLTRAFGFRDESQALVIAYHELMWDVMDSFEAMGLVRKPVAFAKPQQATPADIGDLVFIVRQGPAGTGAGGGEADPETEWLRHHAHPIALEAEGFEDLAFLGPLLEGKRVVQLGENTHGTREYNQVKARIVRYLHQELGYDVLAFESAPYQCYDADLTAGTAPARTTLLKCAYGVWHAEEVLPLFEYMRATRQTEHPLRLAGFDVQPIGGNKADRPQFLSNLVAVVDPEYAAEVFALDSTFLEVYARDGDERRAYFRSEDGQRMAEAYDRLAAFFRDHEAAIRSVSGDLDAQAVDIARQTARSMAWYVRRPSAPTMREYVQRRDEGMAENLEFLLEELYPGQKVIVWGHNFHVRHNNLAIPADTSLFIGVPVRTMGSWIHERYGDQVYTVGLYAYRGRAANNSGEVYEIAPAEPGSLEGRLHGLGAGAVFVDLSQAPEGPATAWMDEPVTARYNGTTALSLIVRDQYDAILFVEHVTPRVMLY